MSWQVVYTAQARRDAKKLLRSGLKPQAQALIDILADNPYKTPPPYEKLAGELTGACSRRINIQQAPVWRIIPKRVESLRYGYGADEWLGHYSGCGCIGHGHNGGLFAQS